MHLSSDNDLLAHSEERCKAFITHEEKFGPHAILHRHRFIFRFSIDIVKCAPFSTSIECGDEQWTCASEITTKPAYVKISTQVRAVDRSGLIVD